MTNHSPVLKTGNNILRNAAKNLINDKFYIAILLLIFLKSMLFIGYMGTTKASGINTSKGFFSAPPYLEYLLYVVLILSFTFLLKGRKRLWALFTADILMTAFFLADALYFRATTCFLNLFILADLPGFKQILLNAALYFRPIDIIFILDIPFICIYILFVKDLYRGSKRSLSLFLFTLIIPLIYITYYHYKIDVYKRCFYGQTAFVQSWAPTQTMSSLGPIGYHLFDIYNYYENSRPYVLTSEDKEEISNWYKENKEELPDNKYLGMFKNKNLIIIQVESLENFVVNLKVDGQEITPNINKLLNNSLYFNNYHENVNNGISADSDLLTNTGLYPVSVGSTYMRYPGNTYKYSLPNVLESKGYNTLAIHPDKGSFWNWVPAMKSIGFDKCMDATSFNINENIGLGISDIDYFNQIAPVLDKMKNPFYAFMVTQSSHGPFDIPESDRELKLDESLHGNIMGDYLQSIHYADKAVGKFINELKSKGLLNNTMLVIYGDHTGVHKFYQDKVDAIKPSQDWWMHNEMEVPLIIYNPSVTGKTFSIEGGQIDVMPTIEYLMGIDKSEYENEAMGKVLLNTNKNYTILQNFKMYGNYTEKDEKHAKNGITISDKIIRSDYFKNK